MSWETDVIKGWWGPYEKKKAQHWGFMETLWVGTSPASGHNQHHHTGELKWRNLPDPIPRYLTQYDIYEGWEGLGAKLLK